jgi:hypothetical protein
LLGKCLDFVSMAKIKRKLNKNVFKIFYFRILPLLAAYNKIFMSVDILAHFCLLKVLLRQKEDI